MWHSVVRGVGIGLRFALVYAVVGAVAYLAGSASTESQYEFSLVELLGFYLAGGLLTGATGGMLAPLVRNNVAAFMAGVLASAPTCLLLFATLLGVHDRAKLLVVTSMMCLLLGGPCGIVVRNVFEPERRGTRRG